MPNITFRAEGISKRLSNINPNKSGGPDELPERLLKECAVELAPLYQYLITTSYTTGISDILPNSWRHAMCQETAE